MKSFIACDQWKWFIAVILERMLPFFVIFESIALDRIIKNTHIKSNLKENKFHVKTDEI